MRKYSTSLLRLPYKYDPLEEAASTIRLITLLPSKQRRTSINVELSVHSLVEDIEYEALSYTWGSAKRAKHIVINRRRLKVTRSLHTALSHLRHSDRKRVLWIDAICINQQDDLEKGLQVQVMGRIYELARHVVIWLGEEETVVSAAVDFMQQCSAGIESTDRDAVLEMLGDTAAPHWSPVANFFNCSWFQRVWVCQEYALAKSRHFQIGQTIITDEVVIGFSRTMMKWWPWFLEWLGADGHLTLSPGDRHPVRYCLGVLYKSVVPLINLDALPLRSPDLLRLLTGYVTGKHATDPRDRIYALLALNGDMSQDVNADLLLPNYTLPAREVYTRTMAYLLLSTDSYSVLSEVRPPAIQGLDLPSWVADWSPTYQSLISAGDYVGSGSERGLYDAGGRVVLHRSNFDFAAGTLTLSGFAIDEISQMFEYGDLEYVGELVSAWQAVLHQELMTEYASGSTVKEAFWRTVFADRCVKRRQDESSRNFVYSVQTVRIGAAIQEISPMPPVSSEHEDALLSETANSPITHGWRLFRCKSGLLGLAKEEFGKGDLVIVLRGVPMPMIVRRLGSSYTLVAECYLHGFMDGQAIVKHEKGDLQLENFTLC